MRKRSEAGKPTSTRMNVKPKLTLVPRARDFEEARYAWRERYAICIDGGATFKTARRLAHAEVPDFAKDALEGAFDFPVAT